MPWEFTKTNTWTRYTSQARMAFTYSTTRLWCKTRTSMLKLWFLTSCFLWTCSRMVSCQWSDFLIIQSKISSYLVTIYRIVLDLFHSSSFRETWISCQDYMQAKLLRVALNSWPLGKYKILSYLQVKWMTAINVWFKLSNQRQKYTFSKELITFYTLHIVSHLFKKVRTIARRVRCLQTH